MIRKIIVILIVMCSLLSCSKKAEQEIIFWHALGGPLGDALNTMISDFNREHPDIRIKAISMGNYQALSQKIMASIQAGNQPDIAQVFESWTANLVKGGALQSLNEYIYNDSLYVQELDDFYPVFLKSCTIDDELWSFPFNKSVRVMYYNKDIFYRNGLDYRKAPDNWADFLSTSKLLTQDLDDNGRNDVWGTTFTTDMWRFENLLLQAGGSLMNKDYTIPTFNSQEGIAALEFFDQALNVDKSAYVSTGYDGQNHFLAGNVAMIEGSSVSYVFMKNAEITFNLGIAAVPVDKTKKNIISGTNIAIFNKNNKQKSQAAWEFIKWFTAPEQTAKFSALTYYMPVRRSAFTQSHIQAMLEEHPGLTEVYQQLEFAEFEPQISAWFEFRKNFEEIVLEKVYTGTLSPQEALQNAENRLISELKK